MANKRRSKEEIAKEKELRKEINTEWMELYEYVRGEIMGYSKEISLNKYMVLRLKGLAEGRFTANTKLKPNANYSFKTILYTFKSCKLEILSAFKSNQTKFNGEQHKFNYCMVIVENNINDMVVRLHNASLAKEKAEVIQIDAVFHEGAEFNRPITKEKKNLKDL
jgi:hypothetical protein